MILDDERYLAHYGILRKSGRYPWGSGGTPEQRGSTFVSQRDALKRQGWSETEIAEGFGLSVKQLRETNTIARNQIKAANVARAVALKDAGHSNIAIGKKMGINESSVRSLLAASEKDKLDILATTSSMLRDQVSDGSYLDIGKGVEKQLGISSEKLGSAVAVLKDEGYVVLNVQTDRPGTSKKTTVKVLCPPGTTYRDVKLNMAGIHQTTRFSDNGGRTAYGILPPLSLSSKRVAVRYAEDGGDKEDGVMYVRPGKDDVSLGGSRYAQVRIMVDGTHYLKGMAVYRDDLPKGVDVVFNTNKKRADVPNKLDAMKKISDDPDNPFGAAVRQIGKMDKDGTLIELTSVMNIVNKEGDWEGWKKSIASQVLSKQSPRLAADRLNAAYERRREELDEILALTNPAVKQRLLKSYADSADSAAVHLQAAHLPRQQSHVILPLNSMRDTEVYAPNYRDGERVVLIRYPHGGTFEIPELTVNNRHREAISMLGRARDAIAINSKVAERLSGADFDGDSVLVIPNDSGAIKTSPALAGLKNFDTKRAYPPYDGMPTMDGGVWREDTRSVDYGGRQPSGKVKQQQMGLISNLITDMTIAGASNDELAKAVRHSMVVIDAEKHSLNYKESAIRNGIPALTKKYQPRPGGRAGGASTLISRARSPATILARRPARADEGGPIDRATGRKMYKPTGEKYVDAKGRTIYKTQRSVKLRETDDAFSLSSGTPIESVYATHSNRMKALGNEARREYLAAGRIPVSPSAKRVYAKEVESLNAKLNIALVNSPRERQAQVLAGHELALKKAANPNMDHAQQTKIYNQALVNARIRVGAKKQLVEITDREWEAIQAGAITSNKLKLILDNTDLTRVQELATPRTLPQLSTAALSRARQMAAQGRTQSEIADALGVALSTVKRELSSSG